MPYLMWSLPLAFFTYQFILRLWPSLMMQPIMQQFSIDATSFGLLASAYYYGYAGMQIPVAILLDRYGARPIVFGCAVVCGLATLLFATTDSWIVALITRFMIGAGSAAGFLATSKVVSQWFSKEHYGRMIGFSFSVGLMGAIYGGKPIGILVNDWGGQQVALVLGGVSIAIGVLAYLFLRTPSAQTTSAEPFKLQDIKSLLTSPTIMLLAVANLLMVGVLEGFADVWGVNYLMTAFNVAKVNAAEMISFIFVGMLFGGPALAVLSRRFGNFSVISLCGITIALLFSYLILIQASFDIYILASLFFVIGLLCCYQVLVFSAASDLVDARQLGVTVAFLNCINMLGGSFFHSLIGFFMDLFWGGEMIDGLRQYGNESYTYALMLIPVCAVIGSVMVMIAALRAKKDI